MHWSLCSVPSYSGKMKHQYLTCQTKEDIEPEHSFSKQPSQIQHLSEDIVHCHACPGETGETGTLSLQPSLLLTRLWGWTGSRQSCGVIPCRKMPQEQAWGLVLALAAGTGRWMQKTLWLKLLSPPPTPLVHSLNSPHWVIQAGSHQKKEVAVWGMADDQEFRQLR